MNQGEKGTFKGHFQQRVGDDWTYIEDLTPYGIRALVVNDKKNKKYIFSTTPAEGEYEIKISDDTYKDSQGNSKTTKCAYEFVLTEEMTASMLGECTLEVALIKDGTPLITDNKGNFVIKDSLLGRIITNGRS